jgi:DedD protein
MPSPIGDDELKLKHRARRRLIGAIALLAALVLALPLVLDKEPKHATNEVAVHIPAPQQTPLSPEAAPQAPETKPDVIPPPKLEPSAPSQAAPQPVPAPPPVEKPAKSAATHGLFVQVGVFSHYQNAKAAQAKLAKNGLKAIVESVTIGGSEHARVRVGPFDNRKAADDALAQVKRMGEKDAAIVKVER